MQDFKLINTKTYESLEPPSKFKIQNMKYAIWNSKYVFGIPNTYLEFQIQYLEFHIRYSEFQIHIWNSKYPVRNSKYVFGIPNTLFGIPNTLFGIPNTYFNCALYIGLCEFNLHNMLVYLKERLPRIQRFFFILTLKKLLFDEMGVGSSGRGQD